MKRLGRDKGGGETMRIGNKEFLPGTGHVYVMGILNLTPDSFSDGGRYTDRDAALRHAEEMIRDGAEIIDLGAESTRPGAAEVTAEEEKERLLPLIELLRREFDVPISVDTYKAQVMDAAFAAGADLANDIWGFRYEELHPELCVDRKETMAEVVARYGRPVVLMHNDLVARSAADRTEEQWRLSGVSPEGREDVLVRVKEGWERTLAIAERAGVGREKIILDPGVGFAKTQEENLRCISFPERLLREDCSLLLGTSRKSVLGNLLELPTEDRDEATAATTILGAEAGYSFVRVHNVKMNRRMLDLWEKVRETASETQ